MSVIINQTSNGGASPVGHKNSSIFEANKFATNQQMYESFVRGNLVKKRQSQYSERKQLRENEKYLLSHQFAVVDLQEHGR